MPYCSMLEEVRALVDAKGEMCESASLLYSKFLQVPKASVDKSDIKSDIVRDFAERCKPSPYESERDFQRRCVFFPKNARAFVLRLGGRLIVNQARGVLENAGICLHRNFSCPCIPGSALKGVARHYAWEKWKNEEDEQKKREQAKRIAETFGFPTGDKEEGGLDKYLAREFPEDYGSKNTARSGSVAFLDGMPWTWDGNGSLLETDVCTCHHPDYYKPTGPQKAYDDESPNPQTFPVVRAGVAFCFRLVPVRKNADEDFAEEMLRGALLENGVGGKTAAGYGWFREDANLSEKFEKTREFAQACAETGNAALVEEISAKTNSELGEFLKKPELSPEEISAFKIAANRFDGGKNNKCRTLFRKGKGPAFKNLVAVFGEEEARRRFG